MLYKHGEWCPCTHPKIHCRFLLGDFGFSKPYHGFGNEITTTQRHGTQCYRAPELVRRETNGRFSQKTDMWAFGCVLLNVASTGRKSAFRWDDEALDYERNPDQLFPALQQWENPLLTNEQLSQIHGVMRRCLEPVAQSRPEAAELYDEMVGWNWG